jgi:peptide/nickel transport system permease protein
MNSRKKDMTSKERYYLASQWQLMWGKFFKHKLAIFGMVVLGIFYLLAVFCEFVSPYTKDYSNVKEVYVPPQVPRIHDKATGFHFRPFVYGLKMKEDPITWEKVYAADPDTIVPIHLFERGQETYKMWNLFSANWHLFGVRKGSIHLFGTDKLGRDVFSRSLYATRISLSVGFIGVGVSFVLGIVFGGISGYYGGAIDIFVQRVIEFLLSLPVIPLWMALAAAFPPEWSSIKVYFAITMILSLRGWTALARVVRGILLRVREEDFIMAAKTSGLKERTIIRKHMIPSVTSYLIVNLTLAIPEMIIGEVSLSFLGLGIRPPSVSWGTLMQDAQNVRTVVENPWLIIPAAFVVMAVLAFNFLGDGLRDAADPYK